MSLLASNNTVGLPPRTHPGVRGAVRLAVVALALCWAAQAHAADVLAILSSDAQPYRDAQAAIEKTCGAHGDRVTAILLSRALAADSEHPLPKADTIIAIGTDAAVWTHDHAPGSNPIYYCMVPNIHEAGLDSGRIARGVTTDVPLTDQLAIIAQTLPSARTIGMLYRSDTPEGRQARDRMSAALPAGWKIEAVAVNEYESKARAIEELLSRRIDCAWTAPDPAIYDVATIRSLLLTALRRTVPVYGFSQALVRAGGLVGANIDPGAQGFQVASLLSADLDRQARTHAATLAPVIQPPTHQVVVNLIVAEKLGLKVPDALVQRAAIVFRDEPARIGGAP